jgi:hypothetical protein
MPLTAPPRQAERPRLHSSRITDEIFRLPTTQPFRGTEMARHGTGETVPFNLVEASKRSASVLVLGLYNGER